MYFCELLLCVLNEYTENKNCQACQHPKDSFYSHLSLLHVFICIYLAIFLGILGVQSDSFERHLGSCGCDGFSSAACFLRHSSRSRDLSLSTCLVPVPRGLFIISDFGLYPECVWASDYLDKFLEAKVLPRKHLKCGCGLCDDLSRYLF